MSNVKWRILSVSLASLLAACSRSPAGPSYRVYVSNEASGNLTVIDPVKMEALATFPLGKRCRGIHSSADGKLLFVTSEDEAIVTVVDVASASELKKIKVGHRPRGIAFLPDGSRAYVTNENDATLSVIDVAKLEVTSTIPLSEDLKPMGLA